MAVQDSKQDISLSEMIADVEFLEKELPRLHKSFDKLVTPTDWQKRCKLVREALPKLSYPAQALTLNGLIASLGVAHTNLYLAAIPFKRLPVAMMCFEDGVYVYATNDSSKELSGCKVLQVGGKGTGHVIDKIAGLEPSENIYWKRNNLPIWSSVYDAYLATNLVEKDGKVKILLETGSGKKIEREFEPIDGNPKLAVSLDRDKFPPYMRRLAGNYQILKDEASKTLILDYRKCTEDAKFPLKDVVSQFWKEFKEGKFENIALDLRRNEGGNSTVIWPFLQSLRAHKEFDRKRHLYGFISNQTFSSGTMAAVDLVNLGGRLVGSPTGGSPNSFGEQKYFSLPNSKIQVKYCTSYFELIPGFKGNTVEPAVFAPIRYKDIISGKDACLEYLARSIHTNQDSRK